MKPRLLVGDPKHETRFLGWTRDPIGETRDPGPISQVRPGILKSGPGTRYPSHGSEPRPPTIKVGLNTLSIYGARDSRTGTLSMNEFICFMRLCLFRMFLVTLSYDRNTLIFYHLHELLFRSC